MQVGTCNIFICNLNNTPSQQNLFRLEKYHSGSSNTLDIQSEGIFRKLHF